MKISFNDRTLLRMEGAVQCLEQLIEHARTHLYEIDTTTVKKYLKSTRAELKKARVTSKQGPID